MNFHSLKIKTKTQETPDTVTLEFDVPEDLAHNFKFKAGQYLTLRTEQGGQELRRSYSMSSSPLDGKLAVTVKKVKDGRVSTWLHDTVQVGDAIEVARPEGRFTATPQVEKLRTWYLFAGGSGITPIFSIIKTVLESEPKSTIFLLYGSRNEEQIIFRDELNALSKKYLNQLFVEHVLSSPKKEGGGGIFGFFKKAVTNWQGKKGRIVPTLAELYLDENTPHGKDEDSLYYLCGPGNMADALKMCFLTHGIDEKRILTEVFTAAGDVPGGSGASSTGGKSLKANIRGEMAEVSVAEGSTVLDALVDAGYEPPYSCTSGACSTCMAKVTKGEVRMDTAHALDDSEIKNGYILTCQAHIVSADLEIDYEA